MSTARALAVTGSTGRLGGKVAHRLAATGIRQRLIVRRPDAAPRLPGATVAVADYADRDGARTALEGVGTLFMVSGAEAVDRVDQHRTFLTAAADAGVAHVVYLSFAGAAADATFLLARDHWATERHLIDSGMGWTFLRDNLYLEDTVALVGPDGVIRGPAGDGRLAAVAQDDIADAAVAILRDPSPHAGVVHELTGPAALSLGEVADTISEVTSRSVRYVEETLAQARASRASFDAPAWLVDAWISTYAAIAAGELATVTDAIPRLTGHPATTLASLLRRG